MADDTKMKSAQGGTDSRAWIAAAGAVVAALIAIPTVLGAGLYWLSRRYARLTRFEYGLLAIGACTAVVVGSVAGGHLTVGYLKWMWSLPFGTRPRTDIPWFTIVVYAVAVCGVVGTIAGTAVAERIPKMFRPSKVDDRPSIMPTDRERKRMSIAAPPVLTPDPQLHAVDHDEIPMAEREFPLGIDTHGRPVMLSMREIGLHGLIFGSTGSGKSETLKVLSAGMMDIGVSGIILDLKEDVGLRDWCAAYAAHHSMMFQELRLSDPDPGFWFNPLTGLSPDEARDTVLSLTRFDDEHWQNINKQMLGQLVKLMYFAHQVDPAQFPAPSMYEIGRVLSSTSLAAATKKMRATVIAGVPGTTQDDFLSMSNPTQDQQKSASGFGAKIGQIYDTHAGRLVLQPAGSRAELDVTKPGLIYIGLDSQGKPDLTRMVSSAVLQRLSVDAAQRTTGSFTGKKQQKFLIVDEANWVDRTIVQNLLSRARSAGISVLLSTQGPKDWIDKTGDDFAKLSQNTNVAMIMSQGEPESAELCADYIGKTEFYSASYSHRDGEMYSTGSTRREVDHLVTPDQLRRMGIGEMVLRVGKPSERITYVKVIPRDPTVQARAGGPTPRGGLPSATLARPPRP